MAVYQGFCSVFLKVEASLVKRTSQTSSRDMVSTGHFRPSERSLPLSRQRSAHLRTGPHVGLLPVLELHGNGTPLCLAFSLKEMLLRLQPASGQSLWSFVLYGWAVTHTQGLEQCSGQRLSTCFSQYIAGDFISYVFLNYI